MQVMVLTNPAAGVEADAPQQLRDAFAAVGVDAEIVQVPGEQMTSAARNALEQRVDAVVAAGGDGTVSAVAAALAGTETPLGIIPTGTLNHFARDLNLPLE